MYNSRYMERLITNVAQLDQVLHGVANGITIQDPAHKLVFVNRAAARMMNCKSPAEAVKKGGAAILEGFKFYNEHGRPIRLQDLPGRRALAGVEEPEMIVGYTSTKHEGIRWTSIKAMPVFGENGQVSLAVNVLQDMTQLKETERQLREANARITRLLEKALQL